MTDTLILDSLEIKNFRTFRHLQIERLGRVNLIVGKNNVGKSSLLEALRLYAHQGEPEVIWSILAARDESKTSNFDEIDVEERVTSTKHLFYGRQEIRGQPKAIEIGPLNSTDQRLNISASWFIEQIDEQQGRMQIQPIQSKELDNVDNPTPGLVFRTGRQTKIFYPLDRRLRFIRSIHPISYIFIPASGVDRTDINWLWDQIALTSLEEDVLASLQIIAPNVERVGLINRSENGKGRMAIVKLAGQNTPLPLRSLGEGMKRLFGLALALVNAKDGLLLIDEIESGLHYSVQPDMWRLIFEVARRLNVQVFATTHSWDCIEAFQQAAQENDQAEGVLVSLRRKKASEDIVAVIVDEAELGIVTRQQIEVR